MSFSVIVPTLNCVSTVSSCLSSLLEQTYPHLEVIVVDGGSTDGTAEYVSSLADPRVKLVSAPGSSIYRAMNIGIRNSTGDYLLFLGADDRLYSADTLQRLDEIAAKIPDLIVGNAMLGDKPFYSNVGADLSYRHTMHHQAVLYRRSTIEHFGGFNESFTLLADFELDRRIVSSGARTILVDQFVSRCGASGVSQRRKWRLRFERLRLTTDWRRYLASKLKSLTALGNRTGAA